MYYPVRQSYMYRTIYLKTKKGFSDVRDELNYTCCLASFMGICSNANVLTVMS